MCIETTLHVYRNDFDLYRNDWYRNDRKPQRRFQRHYGFELGSRDGCNKRQNRTYSSGVSRDMNRNAVKSDLGKTFFIQVTVRDRFYPRFLGMSEFLISFRFPWSATGLLKSLKSTKIDVRYNSTGNLTGTGWAPDWKYGQTRLLCSLCAVMFIYLQNYFRLYKCW